MTTASEIIKEEVSQEEESNFSIENMDLTKAVIYSEILKRPAY